MSTYLSAIAPPWGDVLVVLVSVYAFFVFLKQALKQRGELRAVSLVLGLVVLPLLMVVHFAGRWDLSDSSPFNQLGRWWVIPLREVHTTADNVQIVEQRPFNLILAGLVLSGLYIGATLLVWGLSAYYWVKRKSQLLAIRKVLIKLAVLLLGLIIYLKSEGIDLTPLWVGMGAASIVVGIALQEPLSSLFKGLALDMEGVFHRGEWIRVGGAGGVQGKVVDKNWRTTKIMTIDDELITIANSSLGSEQILNYNQPEESQAHRLLVGASYNDPPVKVKEILRNILLRDSRIERDPPPRVRTINYGDFSVDYEMKFWIRNFADHPGVKDAVMTQIWYAFKFYGIEIPFPIRTVHMKERAELDEGTRAIERRAGDIQDFLQTLPFFNAHLNYRDFEFLARNAFQRRYGAGEHVIQAGEIGDAVYIVREGFCEVILPGGKRRRIDPGAYFGEMGLISKQPRSADVIAGAESATTVRVDRECMQLLFHRYPDLRQEFEHVKDARMEDSGWIAEKPKEMRISFLARFANGLKDFLLPW